MAALRLEQRMALPPRASAASVAGVGRPLLAALATAIAISIAILVIGRTTGRFEQPLPGGALVVLGAALLVFAGGAAALLNRLSRKPQQQAAARMALVAIVVITAAAVSIPGTSVPAALVFWLLIAVAALVVVAEPRFVRSPVLALESLPVFRAGVARKRTANRATAWQRRRTTMSGDLVEGVVRLALEPGQRVAVGHVAFCPPFAAAPRIAARLVGLASARLKVSQSLPQGARFECRLSSPAGRRGSVTIAYRADGRPRRLD